MLRPTSVRVHVQGGRSRLELRRGATDTALLLDGEPAVLVGPDPEDPTARVLVRAHHLAALDACVADLDADELGSSLTEALRPVLELLSEGTWAVTLSPEVEVEPAGAEPDEERPWAGLRQLPVDAPSLVATMPDSLLDPRAIAAAERRIRGGGRPLVVVVCAGGEVALVVAGHAALAAYRRLARPAPFVRLEAEDPAPLGAEEAADLWIGAARHVGQIVAAWCRHAQEAAGAPLV